MPCPCRRGDALRLMPSAEISCTVELMPALMLKSHSLWTMYPRLGDFLFCFYYYYYKE